MVDTQIGEEEVGGVEAGPTVVSFFLNARKSILELTVGMF